MANGRFVSNLALDSTQGPAASASGGVSAITRIHAPFYNSNTPSTEWGQRFGQQVQLLGAEQLRPHFPVENGKLIFYGSEPREFEENMAKKLLPLVRLGLHRDVRAYFGRRQRKQMAISSPVPIIDQVFVAALNMHAPNPYRTHVEIKTRFLLQAAYEATYLASCLRETKCLVLTLVGGGSFANPFLWIASAIAKAHAKWSKLSQLQRVRLPIYALHGLSKGESIDRLVYDALMAVGIPKAKIEIRRVNEKHFKM